MNPYPTIPIFSLFLRHKLSSPRLVPPVRIAHSELMVASIFTHVSGEVIMALGNMQPSQQICS